MNNHVQVLLYTSYLHIIGGIETFVINFIRMMGSDYQIGVLCPRLPDELAKRISTMVNLYQGKETVSCDTLIMVRMADPIPNYVKYSQSIRMCHAFKSDPSWEIRQDCDRIIHVSKASKRSFESKGKVIYNPLYKTDNKALMLVSATRIPAPDKGQNAARMLKLAKMLNTAQIPFLWFNFSDQPLSGAPKGFVNVGTFQDIQPFIKKADYLVQLSDHEGFCYSVAEALMLGTAVICTPFETLDELGVVDGESGYIVPYDLNFDVNKLLNVPQFEAMDGNQTCRQNWNKILKVKPPMHINDNDMLAVRVRVQYKDLEFNRTLFAGEIVIISRTRAEYLEARKLVTIIEGG
jgi:hypothetical protein